MECTQLCAPSAYGKEVWYADCRGWSRLIRTSGGVVVGLTVQPVQAWKKRGYKLFD